MDKWLMMHTFVSVVREKSFVRSAELLGISPQLASKYVAALEADLGTRLLNRTTRKISLTEAGERYVDTCARLLEGLDELENDIRHLRAQPSGLLRVSAPVSFGARYLGRLIGAYQQAHPQVTLDVQLNDRTVDIVEEGFDLALRIGQLKNSSLVARKLCDVPVIACAAPAYIATHGAPQVADELAQHTVLRYAHLAQALRVDTQKAPIISNNGDLLMDAACTGVGIAIAPAFMAQAALAQGHLLQLLDGQPVETLGLYAVYPHRTLLPLKVRSFVDYVTGQLKEPLKTAMPTESA